MAVRLHFIIEGQTEETFVNQTLRPHLARFSIWAKARCVETGRKSGIKYRGGIVTYQKARKDIALWMLGDQNADAGFTPFATHLSRLLFESGQKSKGSKRHRESNPDERACQAPRAPRYPYVNQTSHLLFLSGWPLAYLLAFIGLFLVTGLLSQPVGLRTPLGYMPQPVHTRRCPRFFFAIVLHPVEICGGMCSTTFVNRLHLRL